MSSVAVVIPTVGRDSLRLTLMALATEDYDELIVVRDRGRCPAAARNRGWQSATSDLLVFLDDDVIPDEGFIGKGRAFMDAHPAVDIAQGATTGAFVTSPTFMFVTAHLWVRRSWLHQVSFDESFGPERPESDLWFGWESLDAGAQVAFMPKVFVDHPGPNGSGWSEEHLSRFRERFPARCKRMREEGSSWQ